MQKKLSPIFFGDQKEEILFTFKEKIPITIIIDQSGYKLTLKLMNKTYF